MEPRCKSSIDLYLLYFLRKMFVILSMQTLSYSFIPTRFLKSTLIQYLLKVYVILTFIFDLNLATTINSLIQVIYLYQEKFPHAYLSPNDHSIPLLLLFILILIMFSALFSFFFLHLSPPSNPTVNSRISCRSSLLSPSCFSQREVHSISVGA